MEFDRGKKHQTICTPAAGTGPILNLQVVHERQMGEKSEMHFSSHLGSVGRCVSRTRSSGSFKSVHAFLIKSSCRLSPSDEGEFMCRILAVQQLSLFSCKHRYINHSSQCGSDPNQYQQYKAAYQSEKEIENKVRKSTKQTFHT